MSLHLKALDTAIKELGKSEIPKNSNWGTHVQKYLSSVGINFPAPWCMGFVYWCFDEAAKELKIKNPLVKTGHVLTHFNKARQNGALRFITTKKSVMPGDIMIMRFANNNGHTGIVRHVDLDKNTVTCVEGNTNDDGSREGFEVAERTRNINTIHAFLRY